MRRLALLLSIVVAPVARGQASCEREPARSALIGGAIGLALVVGPAVARDRNHHLDHGEWLPYTWGATAGAVLGSTFGARFARQRCPQPIRRARPDTVRNCARSVVAGGARGAAVGGVMAFLAAPLVALPIALTAGGPRPGAFERAIGVITVGGAASGLVIGAVVGHRC